MITVRNARHGSVLGIEHGKVGEVDETLPSVCRMIRPGMLEPVECSAPSSDLEAAHRDLLRQHEALHERRSSLSGENAQLQRDLVHARSENAGLTAKVAELDAQLAELTAPAPFPAAMLPVEMKTLELIQDPKAAPAPSDEPKPSHGHASKRSR